MLGSSYFLNYCVCLSASLKRTSQLCPPAQQCMLRFSICVCVCVRVCVCEGVCVCVCVHARAHRCSVAQSYLTVCVCARAHTHMLSCSVLSDSLARQAPLSMGFPRQEYCHFLLQGIFLTQRWNLHLLQQQADSLPTAPPFLYSPVLNGQY